MKTIKWKAFISTRVDRCSRTKLQPFIYSTYIQVYIQSMMSLFVQFRKYRKQILVAEFYFCIIYSSNSTIPYSWHKCSVFLLCRQNPYLCWKHKCYSVCNTFSHSLWILDRILKASLNNSAQLARIPMNRCRKSQMWHMIGLKCVFHTS